MCAFMFCFVIVARSFSAVFVSCVFVPVGKSACPLFIVALRRTVNLHKSSACTLFPVISPCVCGCVHSSSYVETYVPCMYHCPLPFQYQLHS